MNYNELLSQTSGENLIAKGSTREVYRFGKLVIKKHTHWIGYEQSKKEEEIYKTIPNKEWQEYLTKPYFVSEEYAVFEYVEPLETNPLEGCDIGCSDIDESDEKYGLAAQKLYRHDEAGLISWLNETHGIVTDDLYLTHNLGIREERMNFVFLDYGMDKKLFKQYDNAVIRGEIAYHIVETCPYCKGDAIFGVRGDVETLISCEKCNS